ncbi:phosphopantetheine-binding protein [Streptomyces sp. NPDC008137]|uniref:acyl carrier protein n=1 Tax=Streptomyces sp. NPDC008137 TaxID=3364813 RepID=UPI0036E4E611
MTGEGLRATVEEIWREVLGAEVDDDSDFFDEGGHSFAALRIIAMLNDHNDQPTPVKVLFDNPRFGDFVAALEKETGLSPRP